MKTNIKIVFLDRYEGEDFLITPTLACTSLGIENGYACGIGIRWAYWGVAIYMTRTKNV